METRPDRARQLAHPVQIRIIRLKATFAGIVVGALMAAGLFVATNWLVLKGGSDVGRHLQLLSQYFVGYSVTFRGSLIGAAYAFVLGFLGAYVMAWMYNGLSGLRAPACGELEGDSCAN